MAEIECSGAELLAGLGGQTREWHHAKCCVVPPLSKIVDFHIGRNSLLECQCHNLPNCDTEVRLHGLSRLLY
jgi:hypothetical protein